MSGEVKQAITEVMNHPKTTGFAALAIQWASYYVDNIAPVIVALTSIGSFTLIILLVLYQLKKNKKIDQDFELDSLKIDAIKNKTLGSIKLKIAE